MPRPRSRWIRICTLLLVISGALFGGCQKILGEYEVVAEPPITFCTASDKRCVGPSLYVCGPELDSWLYQKECRSAAHCASREGGCLACAPGEYRCSAGLLEVCGDDGDFTLAEDCGDANRCNLNSDSCRPCTVGEFQCNGANLMQCTAEKVWMVTECDNEAACTVEPNRQQGVCAEPTCTAGTHVCNGAKLMRCHQSGQQWVEIDTCASEAEVCDAAAADRQAENGLLGSCVEACKPDAARCVDATFQTCSALGTWQTMATCESPGTCSAKLDSAGCQSCTPGSLECNDGVLRRCTEAGWELVKDCGSAALCNEAAGKCEAAACPLAGQTRCEATGLQHCALDQSEWEEVTFCKGDLCNANDADCDPAACVKGAKRCWNNRLEACNPSLRDWDVVEECEAGETCSLEGCVASACDEGASRCNDIYRETCVEGVWEHLDRCATSALCDPSQPLCEPPVCEPGEFQCVGSSLRICADDQTQFDEFGQCHENEICDQDAGACVPAP